MNQYEKKLKKYIIENNIICEQLIFDKSCHSVEDASKTANIDSDNIIKNICMLDSNNNLIVAIVKGKNRASTSKIAKVLNIERPRLLTPQEILDKTGYPCGGTPSFGYNAIFLIDPCVLLKDYIYTGGGSNKSLIKINTKDLIKANKGKILRIKK
jgi:Cys-tRNA(Pro)/Cys-tRNA(Cys) deacylase